MINIDLYGDPVAMTRPRFARRGNFVHTYDPQANLKETFKWQIKSQYRDEPIKAPVSLDITFYMPIPKSTSKRKKRQMLNGVCFHMVKPDIDNLSKFLLDCLNKIVLEDDAQVIELRTKKIYSENPGTLVRIFPREQIEDTEHYEDNTRLSR